MMFITKKSPYTGKLNTMDLPVTQEQLDELAAPRQARRMIQEIFPGLAPEQREFLMTGYTPSDWDAVFAESESAPPRAA